MLISTKRGRKGNTLRSFATCMYNIQHFWAVVNIDFFENCQNCQIVLQFMFFKCNCVIFAAFVSKLGYDLHAMEVAALTLIQTA